MKDGIWQNLAIGDTIASISASNGLVNNYIGVITKINEDTNRVSYTTSIHFDAVYAQEVNGKTRNKTKSTIANRTVKLK